MAVTEDYDLVFMDIKMPQWNGLKAINGLEMVKPNLKIIVISNHLQEQENKTMEQYSNIIKIVHKPFLIKNILELIKEVIL